jgi:hypothetical protein
MSAAAPPISAPVVPPPSTVTPQPPSELKEYVAALLSIAIVAVTLVLLWRLFKAGDSWEQQSSIVQLVVGFTGTVTGYYFGRIPAERAATNAQQAANTANQSLLSTAAVAQQTAANEQRIRSQVAEVRRQLSTPLGGGAESTDVTAYRVHVSQILNRIVE